HRNSGKGQQQVAMEGKGGSNDSPPIHETVSEKNSLIRFLRKSLWESSRKSAEFPIRLEPNRAAHAEKRQLDEMPFPRRRMSIFDTPVSLHTTRRRAPQAHNDKLGSCNQAACGFR